MSRKQESRASDADGPVKVTLSLPAEIVRRVDALAEAERRTRSNAAAVLIERGLDDAPRQAG